MLSVKYGAGWADWMKQYTEMTDHQDHQQQGSRQQLDPSSLSKLLLRNASQSRSRKIFKRKNISIFWKKVLHLKSPIDKLSFWCKIFLIDGMCRRYISNLFRQLLSPSKISAKFFAVSHDSWKIANFQFVKCFKCKLCFVKPVFCQLSAHPICSKYL